MTQKSPYIRPTLFQNMYIKFLALSISTLALVSCSGGGSSTPQPITPTQEPAPEIAEDDTLRVVRTTSKPNSSITTQDIREYNAKGDLIFISQSEENETAQDREHFEHGLFYNEAGQLASGTHRKQLDNVTTDGFFTYHYDTQGNRVRQDFDHNNDRIIDASISHEYNPNNQVTFFSFSSDENSSRNFTEETSYNAQGNITEFRKSASAIPFSSTRFGEIREVYEYDSTGELLLRIDFYTIPPEGEQLTHSRRFEYDTNRQLIKTIELDALGNQTQIERRIYFSDQKLQSVVREQLIAPFFTQEENYEYDPEGNINYIQSLQTLPVTGSASSRETTLVNNRITSALKVGPLTLAGTNTLLQESTLFINSPCKSEIERVTNTYHENGKLSLTHFDCGNNGTIDYQRRYHYNADNQLLRRTLEDIEKNSEITLLEQQFDNAGNLLQTLNDSDADGVYNSRTISRYNNFNNTIEEEQYVSESGELQLQSTVTTEYTGNQKILDRINHNTRVQELIFQTSTSYLTFTPDNGLDRGSLTRLLSNAQTEVFLQVLLDIFSAEPDTRDCSFLFICIPENQSSDSTS